MEVDQRNEAMSFDTTSVNTVRFNGHRAMFFWKMIGRELLWLACSQYVIKLILAKVFICVAVPQVPHKFQSSRDVRLLRKMLQMTNFGD